MKTKTLNLSNIGKVKILIFPEFPEETPIIIGVSERGNFVLIENIGDQDESKHLSGSLDHIRKSLTEDKKSKKTLTS